MPDSPTKRGVFYTQSLAPFCKAMRLSIKCQMLVAASIAGLLLSSSPSKVSGNISKIVLLSVQGVHRARPFSDVLEKQIEGIHPIRVHKNSSTSVIFERRMTGIGGPLFYSVPSIVFGSETFCVRPFNFRSVTAAAYRPSTTQNRGANSLFVSALAAATPLRLPIIGVGAPLKNPQASELKPSQFLDARGEFRNIFVSHNRNHPSVLVKAISPVERGAMA